MDWLTEHWVDVLAIYAGLVTVASIVVKLTPTQKDDAWLKKITDFLAMIALNKK